jgi:hypothetical protein
MVGTFRMCGFCCGVWSRSLHDEDHEVEGLGGPGEDFVAAAARDHRVLVVSRAHVMVHLWQGLAEIAGLGGHLAATGLSGQEIPGVAEPLEQLPGGDGRSRRQRICKVSREQCYAHRNLSQYLRDAAASISLR